MVKLLIVDEQRSTTTNLMEIFELEEYNVSSCSSAQDCKRLILKNKYDLIVYSYHLPYMNGLSLMDFIHKKNLDIAVVMFMPSHENLDLIINECMQKQVLGFLKMPFEIKNVILIVRNILSKIPKVKKIKDLNSSEAITVPEIIGNSPCALKIKASIELASKVDFATLVTGPNGTGKELVAKHLHKLSNRSGKPFVEVNCAAMPNELIEGILFGSEKGSYTSSTSQHCGKFEQANGGTIFLDEIGDMSLLAQAKILRVLQEGKVSRIGSTKDVKLDIRVIAATNKNLRKEIKKGNFREDLFYRLNGLHIHVPSLADRSEDIPDLVNHFMSLAYSKLQCETKEITDNAMSSLVNRSWHGNIRELQNIVNRLIISPEYVITEAVVEECCEGRS